MFGQTRKYFIEFLKPPVMEILHSKELGIYLVASTTLRLNKGREGFQEKTSKVLDTSIYWFESERWRTIGLGFSSVLCSRPILAHRPLSLGNLIKFDLLTEWTFCWIGISAAAITLLVFHDNRICDPWNTSQVILMESLMYFWREMFRYRIWLVFTSWSRQNKWYHKRQKSLSFCHLLLSQCYSISG